jgi:hypothetical protein
VLRAWVYGFLTVVAPVQIAMAAMLVHPALDRPEYFGLAVVTWLGLFGVAAVHLRDDPALAVRTWARLWLVRLYFAPLAFLVGLHVVVVFVSSQQELAALVRSLTPDTGRPGGASNSVGPKVGPPPAAWPVVQTFFSLIWLLVKSALVFVLRLLIGTPVWVWFIASGYSLLRRRPVPA